MAVSLPGFGSVPDGFHKVHVGFVNVQDGLHLIAAQYNLTSAEERYVGKNSSDG